MRAPDPDEPVKLTAPPDDDSPGFADLKKAKNGTRVIYVPGNHDECLRDYCGHTMAGVELCREAIHHHADPEVEVRVTTDSEMISLGDDLQVSGSGQQAASNPAPGVRNIIAVASGKGGVGKSTTAVNLALGLRSLGLQVAVLDADVYGPSMPRLLGLTGRPEPVAPGSRTLKPLRSYCSIRRRSSALNCRRRRVARVDHD